MRHRRSRATQLLLAFVFALAGALGTVGPLDAASGYSLNLYRSGDFVRQTNNVQCVGASMQMMINMVSPSDDRSAATQLKLQKLARVYSDLLSPRPGRLGASVRGWAAGLNELGYGEYVVVGYPTIDEALHAAAEAIRATGRPVGLLVWRGRHAWVMSGFRATADPNAPGDFKVTDAYVLDPLYPAVNATWGTSPSPGTRLSVSVLGRTFVKRRSSAVSGSFPGSTPSAQGWVLVLPVPPPIHPSTWRRLD
jgi:hypothetical protein